MFVVSEKYITFAAVNNKTNNNMLNHAFFFYGFYFYFAGQAERDVAYHHQTV